MGECRQIPMMVVISAVIMAFLVGKTSSSSPSPSPSPGPPDCPTALSNLFTCLDYVMPGSNLTTPGSDCCKAFKGLVANEPICLCQLVANSSATSGFPVDRKRAMGIPTACKLKVPPISSCALLGYPVPPAGTPASGPAPDSTPGNSATSMAAPSQAYPSSSSPSPSPGPPVCFRASLSLLTCSDYVTPDSSVTTPGSDCCNDFNEGLVSNEPVCLCQLVANSKANFGGPVDPKRAMGIPTACKFKWKVPLISSCASLGYPVPPAGTPLSGPTPDSTPDNSETSSGSPPSGGFARSASADFRTSVWTSVVAALAVTGATMAIL